MTNAPLNIVIVGAGAIGSLLACRLAIYLNANVSIFPTKRNATNRANKLALSFTHNSGQSEQVTIALADHNTINNADVIIVALKAFHIFPVVSSLLPHLNSQASLILCHNGMGTLEQLQALKLPCENILTMLTTHGAFRPQKQHIIHTGLGQLDLGLVSGELSTIKQANITSVLNQAFTQVNWHNDIHQKQWQKLAINCVINPLTASLNIHNGEVAKADYKQQVERLCAEISQVATTQQIELPQEQLVETVIQVATATAKNRSSMLCDIDNKQPTEVDFINGYLVKLAQENSIAVPENKALWQQVKQLEQRVLSS